MAWRRARRRTRAGPKGGWLRRSVRIVVRAVLLFVFLSVLWVLLYRFVPPPITFTQIGDLIAGHGVHRDWMSLDDMDRDMVRAAIAAEDSKFCNHRGFDEDAIAEAMRRNARGGSIIRGGSTISQQTAKNAFLWQGGGYFRKGVEAWFTLLIENLWGKRRIMEVYLNIAETGVGTYGVNAGSQRYFGHDSSSMTPIEAARIAAVLPLPKKRGAVAPHGFTRRYGNIIAARVGVVARDGLDACVYRNAAAPRPSALPAKPPRSARPGRPAALPPPPVAIPGEEYEQPAQAPGSTAPPPDSSAPQENAAPGDVANQT